MMEISRGFGSASLAGEASRGVARLVWAWRVRAGVAWRGEAGPGTARLGVAGHGSRPGEAWPGLARRGKAWIMVRRTRVRMRVRDRDEVFD